MAEELFGATVDELVKIDANNEESDDDGDDDKIDFNLVAPRSTQPLWRKSLITQSMSWSKQKVY